jgi:putative zinc finger protein
MMLSCRKASRLLSQAQDRRLSLFERAALGLHLVICDGCRAVSRQLRFMRRALRRLFDEA